MFEIKITMSKQDDIEKLLWCGEVLGKDRFKFEEPMQLTFYDRFDRLLYQLAWSE